MLEGLGSGIAIALGEAEPRLDLLSPVVAMPCLARNLLWVPGEPFPWSGSSDPICSEDVDELSSKGFLS
jgi:hypothetical protein